MFKRLCLVLLGALLISCSINRNISVRSSIHPTNYNYKPFSDIKLYIQPRFETYFSVLFVHYLRIALLENNYTIVENLNEATHILTYQVSENHSVYSNSSKRIIVASFRDLMDDPRRYYRDFSGVLETGYAHLNLGIWENVDDFIRNNCWLWGATVTLDADHYNKYPIYTINLLLNEYGKETEYNRKFSKPKN